MTRRAERRDLSPSGANWTDAAHDYNEVNVRRTGRLLAALAIAATFVVASAAAASAHAELISTDPAAGSRLATAPKSVTLTFGEHVEISLGAVRVYDANGRSLGVSAARHPDGHSEKVTVDLPKLSDGTYVVAWRVVSADSHPVHAAFTFTVGNATSTVKPGLIANLLAHDGGDSAIGALLAIARFLVFAGAAIGVGGLTFLTLVWPAGRVSRSAARIVVGALIVAAIASLVMIGLQAAYATGQGLSAALKPSGWNAVAKTQSGRWWLIRSLLLAALTAIGLSRSFADRQIWRAAALVATVGLFVAMGYSGHGANGRYWVLGLAITVTHLSAMTIWVGGLVLLVLALHQAAVADRRAISRRFSSLAFGSVVVLATSGVVQGWRQVGTLDSLTSTTYGHLLLVKTGLVALVLTVAWFSRRFVRAGTIERLGPAVRGEVGLAAVVLVMTALLVNAPPAITQQAKPFAATLFAGSRTATVDIAPARSGANVMHIYLFDPNGTLQPAASIKAQISLASRDLGPISVPLVNAGPNHAITNDLQFPFAGAWTVEVMAQFGEFDETTFTASVPVR